MIDTAALTTADVQQWFAKHLGIRLGPEMSEYVLRRMRAPAERRAGGAEPPPFPPLAVMGGDARTGLPLRKVIDLTSVSPATVYH